VRISFPLARPLLEIQQRTCFENTLNDTRLEAGFSSRLAVNSLTAARWRAMSRMGRSIPHTLVIHFYISLRSFGTIAVFRLRGAICRAASPQEC
jgi:hypothetical protein